RVAGSSWNQWPDVHGMGGRMPVESARYRRLNSLIAGKLLSCGKTFPAKPRQHFVVVGQRLGIESQPQSCSLVRSQPIMFARVIEQESGTIAGYKKATAGTANTASHIQAETGVLPRVVRAFFYTAVLLPDIPGSRAKCSASRSLAMFRYGLFRKPKRTPCPTSRIATSTMFWLGQYWPQYSMNSEPECSTTLRMAVAACAL
ncbi:hypothetical protein QN402_19285, partial [Pseudomonas sp. FG1]|nr:hypothetical protein [Pseudomonas sp. FG1]